MSSPLMFAGLLGDDSPKAFDPWTESATYQLTYRADVTPLLEKDGPVRLWIPLPAQSPVQQVLHEQITSPWPYRITRDDYGNRMVYVEPSAVTDTEATVEIRVTVDRRIDSVRNRSDATGSRSVDRGPFLGPNRMAPIDGLVRKLAQQAIDSDTTIPARIRALFHFVVRYLSYDKKIAGWGRGDAVRACNVRAGNCTDFHSLFIGMARSYGIAARFVIGFPIDPQQTQGAVSGYHCWAHAYDPSRGWVPIDASEAFKSGLREKYLGQLPSDRVAFTVGRDLILSPPQSSGPLNFFVYPYAEVNGIEASPVPWSLAYQRGDARPNDPNPPTVTTTRVIDRSLNRIPGSSR